MAFLNKRLPVDVSPGVSAAPMFNTSVKQLRGGGEYRNSFWKHPLRTFRAQYNSRPTTRVEEELQTFLFEAAGSLNGFRVRDWSDYTATDEQLATGDGSSFWFPLVKNYGTYRRRIVKPDPSTVTVRVGGTAVSTDDYIFDATNGVVILIDAPVNGEPITWSGEFDVPCRFEDDTFDVIMQTHEIGAVASVGLREIRLRDTTNPQQYADLRDIVAAFGKPEIVGMYDLLDTHVNVNWSATQ